MLWARAGGGYPVCVGAGVLDAAGALWPRPRALLRGRRRARAARCTASVLAARSPARRGRRDDRRPAGRAAQDARRGRARAARAGARAGMQRSDTLVALRRRRGRGPGGLLRGDLPARRRGRAGADHGRRAGRLRLRRQDRRRPPGGARTTSARSISRPRCSPTRRCSRRCPSEELRAGFAEVVKTALIAGGPLWERRARDCAPLEHGGRERPRRRSTRVIEGCARTKLDVVAADERDAGRAGVAQPRPHVRARARVRHRLRRATATARRSRSACSSRCGCPSATPGLDPAVRERGRASCSSAHGLPTSLRRARPPTSCSSTWRATRSAAATSRNLVLLRAPGRRRDRSPRSADAGAASRRSRRCCGAR